MKDCKYFKNNMSAYIDNMLSDAKKKEFDEHLKICPLCKKETEELKSIAFILSSIKKEAPDNLTKNVMAKIENIHTKQKCAFLPFYRYATAFVAIFLLVVVLKTPVMEYFEKDYIENAPITTQDNYEHPLKPYENTNEEIKKESIEIKEDTADLNIKNESYNSTKNNETQKIKSVKRDIIKNQENDDKEQKPYQEEEKEEAPSMAKLMPAIEEEKALDKINPPQSKEIANAENYSLKMAAFDEENKKINITTTLSLDEAISLINSVINKEFSPSEEKIEITLSYDEYTYLYETLKDNTSFSGFENINFGEDVNIVILSK